jgi:hypothetical protein
MSAIYLAAYTSSKSDKSGYRWVWSNPILGEALLSHCLAKIEKPSDVERWPAQHIHGGLLTCDENWLVLYRFLNGGRDALGRLGRFFLASGFIRRDEVSPFNIREALNSPAFSTISDDSPVTPSMEVAFAPDLEADQEGLNAASIESHLNGWPEINRKALGLMRAGGAPDFHLSITGNNDEATARFAGSAGTHSGSPRDLRRSSPLRDDENFAPAPSTSRVIATVILSCVLVLAVGLGVRRIIGRRCPSRI